jgi:hypothetical protein
MKINSHAILNAIETINERPNIVRPWPTAGAINAAMERATEDISHGANRSRIRSLSPTEKLARN